MVTANASPNLVVDKRRQEEGLDFAAPDNADDATRMVTDAPAATPADRDTTVGPPDFNLRRPGYELEAHTIWHAALRLSSLSVASTGLP